MKKILLPLFLCFCAVSQAQQFLGAGAIEFEVRTNNHKIFGDGIWAEMARERFPQFSNTYYQFIFSGDKSVYKFDRYDEKKKVPFNTGNVEDNIWFNDYKANTFIQQKFVFDNTYLLNGELMKIDWKLSPTETREIAGFNCRKATGIIFDSVYVFAFYTDEITVSGGPMGIQGLPGMILGITIPRMFTSWIATRVSLDVDPRKVVAPTKGRKRDPQELKTNVQKATKDWGTWGQQSVWQIFL